jgi:coenzyme F420 hydrogenase subunit beta
MDKQKTYTSLKDEVWDTGICSGCGACVAVCPADALFFYDEPGITHPNHSGYCKQESDHVPCGACYEVCPRVLKPKNELLGEYLSLTAARAKTDIPYKQSGGAVTAILLNALKSGMIDWVITLSEDKWTHRPVSILITSAGELMENAGSRYNWNVPILKSIKTAVIEKKLSRLVVVGTPCVVQAARRIKDSGHDLVKPFGSRIRLIIGLFCTESFNYYSLMEQILKQNMHIPSYQITKMDIKGNLEISINDDRIEKISLKEIESAIQAGCRSCTDFSALDSDISAGSVGTQDGWTTLLIRTDEGSNFMQSAVQEGMLELNSAVDINPINHLAQKKVSRKK